MIVSECRELHKIVGVEECDISKRMEFVPNLISDDLHYGIKWKQLTLLS